MEIVFVILVLIAVITLAGVLFCLWVAKQLVGAICRAIWPTPTRQPLPTAVQKCHAEDCQCLNPDYARFCRRCGRGLPAMMRLAGSRAA